MFQHVTLFIRELVNSTLALMDKLIMWSVGQSLYFYVCLICLKHLLRNVPRNDVCGRICEYALRRLTVLQDYHYYYHDLRKPSPQISVVIQGSDIAAVPHYGGEEL